MAHCNDSVVEDVVSLFRERARIGREKYGQTMDRADLSVAQWSRHMMEELMDATVYLRKLTKEMDVHFPSASCTMSSRDPDTVSQVCDSMLAELSARPKYTLAGLVGYAIMCVILYIPALMMMGIKMPHSDSMDHAMLAFRVIAAFWICIIVASVAFGPTGKSLPDRIKAFRLTSSAMTIEQYNDTLDRLITDFSK
jgi:hypothetical protein